VLVLVVGATTAGVVERTWVDAQVRALEVISTTGRVPVLAWTTRLLTADPRVAETLIGDVPTTVVRPGRGDRWPAMVFVNGVTARGRHHPDVRRLAVALARVGFVVFVPDPPGLARGEITERTLAATIAVTRAAAARRDVRNGRVTLLGVSNGTTLSLLAAEDATVGDRVTLVAGIAPYTDLVEMTRLATTGSYLEAGKLVPYDARPFLGLVIARSLVSALPSGSDRDTLQAALRRLPDDAPHPLALFRAVQPDTVAPSARALVRLLANRTPERFDRLYAALPLRLRQGIERLSPLVAAARLRAPVDIASAPHDKYFPLSETRNLAGAAGHTHVRLTVTTTLHHAIPSFSLSELGDLFRFDGWLVRCLRTARRG